MVEKAATDLGLVIHTAPFAQRSARTQLDIALAAGVLEMSMEVFFIGPAIYQLVDGKEPHLAGLAGGMRGWKTLPQLSHIRCYAECDWVQRIDSSRLMLPIEAVSGPVMREKMGRCNRVLGF